jgi:Ca2+:H+ antiporter
MAQPSSRSWISAHWPWLAPALAMALLLGVIAAGMGVVLVLPCAAALVGAVIAAVHHAEVIAHRVGEPFGTLILALAITVIETSLILSMMFAGGAAAAVLPRDTIFAAVMIICNGVVGLCILAGGLQHREQSFRVEGAGPGLAALVVMSVLVLVLPVFTTTTPSGTYSNSQLVFAALASAALWIIFVFIQTMRHRDYFLPAQGVDDADAHAEPPTVREAWASFGLLLISLVTVVGLAKALSHTIENVVDSLGAPKAVIGIVIAMLVLLPETWAAVRAALANRLQTSMNLAIGSALASTGLTVPAVAIAVMALGSPLILGLEPKDMALLWLTFLVSAITLGTGRTHMMQGAVHLVLFAAFLFLAVVT